MNYVEYSNLLGVEAKVIPCIRGEGVPTTATEGAVGCFYMDTLTGDVYKCTTVDNGVYTWEAFKGGSNTDVVQETGNSETAVMSQKAVSDNFANAIKKTARGEILRITDISPNPRTVKAKVTCPEGVDPTSVTVRVAGANLIQTPYFDEGRVTEIKGVTITVNDDGSLTLNGTSAGDGNAYRLMINIDVPVRGPVTLSGGVKNAALALYVDGVYEGNQEGDPKTFDVSGTVSRVVMTIETGVVFDNVTIRPQLEYGEVATDYEPFASETYTPNADGTIELVSHSPTTSIYSVTEGVEIEAKYNIDLEHFILSLLPDAEVPDTEVPDAEVPFDVVQAAGSSTTAVMSQKAVSDNFANAAKKTISGEAVRIADISPNPHAVNVKVTGPEGTDLTSIKVRAVGKNLVPFPYFDAKITEQSGITVTIDDDGTLTFNGTATADFVYRLVVNQYIPLRGNWTLSGCTGGSPTTYFLMPYVDGSSADSQQDVPVTYSKEGILTRLIFTIRTGAVLENVKVKPQIEYGEEATGFEPYKGVAYSVKADGTVDGVTSHHPAMSIYTETEDATVEVEYNIDISELDLREQLKATETIIKNKLCLYETTEVAGLINSKGVLNASSNYHTLITGKIPCKANDEYIYKGVGRASGYSWLFYNGDTWVGSGQHEGEAVVTIPEGVNYVRFASFAAAGKDIIFELCKKNSADEKYIKRLTKAVEDGSATGNQGNVLYGKKWCVVGDSFTNNFNSGMPADWYFTEGQFEGKSRVYGYLIADRNNMRVQWMAEGGRTLATPVDGTFNNTFSKELYTQIDADVDYITIMLGINDGHHNSTLQGTDDGEDTNGDIPLGTASDTTTATFYGAWNVVLPYLMANYPNAHIGIIVSNGLDHVDYRNATIEMAKKYGLPYIDLNGDERTQAMHRAQNSNLSTSTKTLLLDKYTISSSNSHPNALAHKIESTIIENFLRSI